MTEDTTEEKQPTTDKPNLPDFEVPKGPITPEHQAFLVNADLVRKDIEAKMAALPENNDSARAQKGLERNLQELEHAGRYLKEQPYDKDTAEFGLVAVKNLAQLRTGSPNSINNPDDAAAAANEVPLLFNVLDKFKADNK